MRSRYVKQDEMDCILMALMPENRLACKVMLRTGLRISDVLALKTEDLYKDRISIREMKTGKRRRITLPLSLREELMKIAGKVFVFEHRLDRLKHRTRQAVYIDIKKAAKALRLDSGVSPHSTRKVFAVTKYNACGDMKKIQELLNHEYQSTTLLYALADQLKSKQTKKPRKKSKVND